MIDFLDNSFYIGEPISKNIVILFIILAQLLFFQIIIYDIEQKRKIDCVVYTIKKIFLKKISFKELFSNMIELLSMMKSNKIQKIELIKTKYTNFADLILKLFLKNFNVMKVDEYSYEIVQKKYDKSYMVKTYMDKYTVCGDDLIIFGDSENDKQMLKLSRYAFTPIDSSLREVFDNCDSSKSDGVIKKLMEIL